jgi:1,3-beta-glucanosyltransferase GAS5
LQSIADVCLQTVSTPTCCINRLEPETSYNSNTISSFFKTVDIMSRHTNTLGVLVGTDVIIEDNAGAITLCLRAVTRDLKRYMTVQNDLHGRRILPVGYAAREDDRWSLYDLSGGDTSSAIDFYAV